MLVGFILTLAFWIWTVKIWQCMENCFQLKLMAPSLSDAIIVKRKLISTLLRVALGSQKRYLFRLQRNMLKSCKKVHFDHVGNKGSLH